MEKRKIHRKDFADPCLGCGALCCNEKQFEAPSWNENPRQVDVDRLLFYLTDPNISVVCRFKDGKPTLDPEHWEILLRSRCQFLSQENRCTLFGDAHRPINCHIFHPFPVKGDDSWCDRWWSEGDYGDFTFTDIYTFRKKIKEWFDLDPWSLPRERLVEQIIEPDMSKIEIVEDKEEI